MSLQCVSLHRRGEKERFRVFMHVNKVSFLSIVDFLTMRHPLCFTKIVNKNWPKSNIIKLNCDQFLSGDKNILITFSSSILELLLSTLTPPENKSLNSKHAQK